MSLADPPETSLQNVAAEMALIGAMLCDPKIIDRTADVLSVDSFFDQFLGFIFGTLVREHSLGRSLNPITLEPFLKSDPAYEELGGRKWLFDLTSSFAITIGASNFARDIAEMAQRRRLVEGLRTAIETAKDLEVPIDRLIEQADGAVTAARPVDEEDFELSGADCVKTVIDSFDQPVRGVECHVIPSIDHLLGPMRPSQLIVGAGRPGMGKTATAISYALGAASRGHGTLFISLEMSRDQMGERMAADLCVSHRIPYESIRDRTLTREQQREICRAHERLKEMPLEVIDRSGLTIGRLRMMVRRWVRRFAARGQKLELVIVDYLQLLRADGKMDRFEAVGEISRSLKEIAKEHGIAVFALSQLSRKVEERADKRPQLADLRESGQIEQDADAVLFFLRLEYYLRKEPEPDLADEKRAEWERRLAACQGRIEFICAKRRNGTEGSRFGDFLGAYQAVRG